MGQAPLSALLQCCASHRGKNEFVMSESAWQLTGTLVLRVLAPLVLCLMWAAGKVGQSGCERGTAAARCKSSTGPPIARTRSPLLTPSWHCLLRGDVGVGQSSRGHARQVRRA